jgi:hypothetical protein
MADIFTIKRGDTRPALVATLSDNVGPINLATASQVKLLFKTESGSTVYSRICEVTTPTAGVVTYPWTPDDAALGPLSVVTSFNVEWEITWADGTITTVPNEGYKTVAVVADLG